MSAFEVYKAMKKKSKSEKKEKKIKLNCVDDSLNTNGETEIINRPTSPIQNKPKKSKKVKKENGINNINNDSTVSKTKGKSEFIGKPTSTVLNETKKSKKVIKENGINNINDDSLLSTTKGKIELTSKSTSPIQNDNKKRKKLKKDTNEINQENDDFNESNMKLREKRRKIYAETSDTDSEPKSKKKNSFKEQSENIVSNNDAECASSKAVKILEKLLNPLKTAEFFSAYWETEPLFIERNNSEYYQDLLGSKDIDEMLRTNPLYFGRNVDIVVYENGKRSTLNPVGRAVPSIVWDAYEQGHSIRILNPHTYNTKVFGMLTTLQEYFGTLVGANVYLTPAGSQGFAPHYDDIEAFILQLEGRKYWKLYKPNLSSDELARVSSGDFAREELGEPFFEGALNAGDLLYFPRGTVHEAKTDSEQHSLHLTVSTYQKTSYADLLEEILTKGLKQAVESDIDFRRGLPIGYLKHLGVTNADKKSEERMQLLKTCQDLMLKLIHSGPLDEAADELGRRFMHDALPSNLTANEMMCTSRKDGFVLDKGVLTSRKNLTLKTSIRLVRYYSCRFVKEGNIGVVYFSTQNAKVYHQEEEQRIDVDLSFGYVIEILQQRYPNFVTVDSFPYEDTDALLNFLTDLWDYEIITTKQPLQSA